MVWNRVFSVRWRRHSTSENQSCLKWMNSTTTEIRLQRHRQLWKAPLAYEIFAYCRHFNHISYIYLMLCLVFRQDNGARIRTTNKNNNGRWWLRRQDLLAHVVHTEGIPADICADCVRQSLWQSHRWRYVLRHSDVGHGRSRRIRLLATIELSRCMYTELCIRVNTILFKTSDFDCVHFFGRLNALFCAIRLTEGNRMIIFSRNGSRSFVTFHQKCPSF